ncbi:MAG TPA: efflux RND transporter periplasmic adaptor subunit [Chitinophagaceae bacterium]|nr:efflux RND transporter periplasmic adaptor subunit [Chitinophagaceae bacterium]
MRKNFFWLLLITFLAASCGSGKKDQNSALNDKKVELEKLKNEQKKLTESIAKLEADIAKLDTGAARAEKAKLVQIATIEPADFSHFIELQGKVDAQNISYVAPPNGQGGIVKALYVTQGQYVRKGQVLAKLDDQLIRQQIEPLRVQLSAAEDTYRRTKNLWDQGIGTYQQVLTAQTQVENLRKNIGIIQKQAALMTVTAPASGIADQVNVRVGEAFVGASAVGPQIRIVNTRDLKVVTQVPENYLNKVSTGSTLEVHFPELNKTVTTKVNVVGKVIDPATRTFYIEAKIPSDPNFKPNQIAMVKIRDYAKQNAVTIPMNALQNDEQGKFVMVASNENGKMIARRRAVVVGELYNDQLEVKSGIQQGDVLITEGFQGLYDGQLISTQAG